MELPRPAGEVDSRFGNWLGNIVTSRELFILGRATAQELRIITKAVGQAFEKATHPSRKKSDQALG